jgi:acylglycerol lipase
MSSEPVTSFEVTRDGLSQLQRRWQVSSPRAAVLLVHGIGEHSGRYLHVGARLAAAGFDVLAYDNRGFGQSGGRRAYVDSFDQYVDDIEDRLAERRELGVPTVLIGHSLGGLMSVAYLVSDRTGLDLAVLSAPALAADVPAWQRLLAPVIGRLFPRLFIPAKIDSDLLSRDLAVQKAYVDDTLVIAGATAGLGYEIFQAMKATSAAVERVVVPTYVLHGEIDRLVPLHASDGLARVPSVERRVWPGVRHESFNEPEQDDVMTEMIEWIDRQLTSLPASGAR